MPFKESQKVNPIIVLGAQLTVDVDKRVACPNDVVTISGSLTQNGTPVPNAEIALSLYYSETGELYNIATVYTDSLGNYSYNWTVPYQIEPTKPLQCKDWDVQAVSTEPQARATTKLAIAYRTQLTLNSHPEVTVNQPCTVDGTLKFEAAEASWFALPYRKVKILLDSTPLTTVTTNIYGRYSAEITISEPGTYNLTALFEGEELPLIQATTAPLTVIRLHEIMSV